VNDYIVLATKSRAYASGELPLAGRKGVMILKIAIKNSVLKVLDSGGA
jgi:hypothetical protein